MSDRQLNSHLPRISHAFEKELIPFKTSDGLTLKLLRIGPKSGEPVFATTGYGSNLSYYLPTATELAEQGKSVYLVSPRGLGSGIFRASESGSTEHIYNLQSMSRDMVEVLTMISQKHNDQKVISMGHSLGGIINRLASMGISATKNGDARLVKKQMNDFQSIVKFLVLTSSPPPIIQSKDPESKEDALKFLSDSAKKLQFRDISKPLWSKLINIPFAGSLLKLPMDHFGSQVKNLHELIDSKHLSAQEIKDFLKHGLADQIPMDLMLQLYEMVAAENYKLKTKKGSIDLTDIYFDRSLKNRLPSLIVGTESDFLATKEHVLQEYNFLKNLNTQVRLLMLPGGHMNSVLGSQNIQLIANEIVSFEREHLSSLACSKIMN